MLLTPIAQDLGKFVEVGACVFFQGLLYRGSLYAQFRHHLRSGQRWTVYPCVLQFARQPEHQRKRPGLLDQLYYKLPEFWLSGSHLATVRHARRTGARSCPVPFDPGRIGFLRHQTDPGGSGATVLAWIAEIIFASDCRARPVFARTPSPTFGVAEILFA